MVDKFKVG